MRGVGEKVSSFHFIAMRQGRNWFLVRIRETLSVCVLIVDSDAPLENKYKKLNHNHNNNTKKEDNMDNRFHVYVLDTSFPLG